MRLVPLAHRFSVGGRFAARRVLPPFAAIVLPALIAMGALAQAAARKSLSIYALDVEGGQSTLLVAPSGARPGHFDSSPIRLFVEDSIIVRGQRSFYRRCHTGRLREFADVQVRRVESYLDGTGVGERPIAQSCAQVEGDASAIGRIEFTIRQIRLRGTRVGADRRVAGRSMVAGGPGA